MARAVIVACKKNGPRLFAGYERVQKEEKMMRNEEHVQDVLKYLRGGTLRPCRVVPEVEKWAATFRTNQFRDYFLVLDGLPDIGTTFYRRSR